LTIKDYISKIKKLNNELSSVSEYALKMASFATHDMMSKRIFDNGQNSSGKTFQYSKKPAVIGNIKGVKKIVPNNVSSKSKVYQFKAFNKAQRQSTGKKGYFGRYFPLGYWQFKAFIGRPNKFVNFKLTGGLQLAFNNGRIPTPTKVSKHEWVVSLSNQRAIDLRRNIDSKYGNVFQINKREIDYFKAIYQKEVFLNLAK